MADKVSAENKSANKKVESLASANGRFYILVSGPGPSPTNVVVHTVGECKPNHHDLLTVTHVEPKQLRHGAAFPWLGIELCKNVLQAKLFARRTFFHGSPSYSLLANWGVAGSESGIIIYRSNIQISSESMHRKYTVTYC